MWVWIAKITIPNHEVYQQQSLSGNGHGAHWPRAPHLLPPATCAGALAKLPAPGSPNCTGVALQLPCWNCGISARSETPSLPTWHILRAAAAWEPPKEHSWQRGTGNASCAWAHTHPQLIIWNPHCSFSLTSQPKLFAKVALKLSDSSAPQTASNI